ncbi:NADP-dependent oxidoreductase, partial [Methylobacterium radiotolerans]
MTTAMNRRIVLASRPHGEPRPENFRLEEVPVPQPGPGQVLLRTRWLSLDPYMRGRMSDAKSYAAPVEIGAPITAETVGEVVASNHPDHAVGDLLTAFAGWQEYCVTDAKGSRKVDPAAAPPSTALGV